MKFGESFVFPDPDSRVSHEPLKLTRSPRMFATHVLFFTLLKTRHFWDQKGEIFIKVNNFDKRGAFGFGLKAACSGALLGKI